ncbi:methyltransferase, FxLD system [Streptomyces lydicus]|uniref:methyltransferase, FxLD system n=1 Tax=Streptomyces lydicus TaxID=47763 RepID=UPI003719C12C
MAPDEWPQRLVQFAAWPDSEQLAAEQLLPELEVGAAKGEIAQWSFLRKFPCWRIRYQPTDDRASTRLDSLLGRLRAEGLVSEWTVGIYEPETVAFGGAAGMKLAHELFHRDSRHVLEFAAAVREVPEAPGLGRRELAILLFSVLMRSAGLDRFEQGDVWARVVAERQGTAVAPLSDRPAKAVRQLITVDVSATSRLVDGGPLAGLADWLATFEWAGQRLARLHRLGRLDRGFRAVLAHHLIFHWNRLGLSSEDQSTLSNLAKEAVMGTSESAASASDTAAEATSLTGVDTDTLNDNTATENLRNKLVDQLKADGRVQSDDIEAALRAVPRHVFVRQSKPGATLEEAYADTPVHTKFDSSGASISAVSQPSVNALMLELTEAKQGMRVLEAGAGSGLFAATMGRLVGEEGHVYTIDVDQDLVDNAQAAVEEAGFADVVTVILGDGAVGHPDGAPYDRIVATVGAHGIPSAWLEQLAPDGRLVVPLRLRGSVSRAVAFEREATSRWRSVRSEMCTFMPLRAGVADDPRRLVALTDDGTVKLQFNQEQKADEALRGVLDQPGTEAWSGVTFRGSESPEYMWLWLTCSLDNALSRMEVDRNSAGASNLAEGFRPMAVAELSSIAYLTLRKADVAEGGGQLYEAGAIGHGPAGKELADRVAEEMGVWNRGFRERNVAFEVQKLDDAPPVAAPGRFAFDNALNRIVIEWQ